MIKVYFEIVFIIIRRYLQNVLLGFDRFCNAVLLGNNDETISSRAGRWMNTSPVAFRLCKLLYQLDKNHCKNAVEQYRVKTAIYDKPIAGFIMFVIIAISFVFYIF